MKPNNDSFTPANVSPQAASSLEPVDTPASQKEAAAEIVRAQIENIYAGSAQPAAEPAKTQQALEDINPYDRTHTANPQPTADQWKQYHSAWQTYYQKYYEGYYTHHLNQAKQAIVQQTKPAGGQYFANQPPEEPAEEILSKDEALYDLRQKLLAKVQNSAKKARKSRHFVPITSAIIVMLIFGFLQYNSVIIAYIVAYVSPGNINPQNIVIDPSTDINVDPKPRLIIPKINVDVPVSYDIGNDNASQMKAMEVGVAQFAIPGADSHPGQVGNTAIAGHSSNDLLEPGDYKFIFAQLDKLTAGDSIYANYKGKRYTYTVTGKAVVEPTEVNRLVYPTTKPVMTLITCTPLGTARYRLLVTAEQVSPDPTKSAAAPPVATTNQNAVMPGNSPTLFERIFGKK